MTFITFITLASNVLQGNGGARSKNGIRLCSPVFFWPPDPSFLAAAFQQEKLGDNEPECIVEMTGAIYLDDAAQNIWTINTAQEKAEVHSGSKNRSDQKLRQLAKQ